jgi:hypothetical protein
MSEVHWYDGDDDGRGREWKERKGVVGWRKERR